MNTNALLQSKMLRFAVTAFVVLTALWLMIGPTYAQMAADAASSASSQFDPSGAMPPWQPKWGDDRVQLDGKPIKGEDLDQYREHMDSWYGAALRKYVQNGGDVGNSEFLAKEVELMRGVQNGLVTKADMMSAQTHLFGKEIAEASLTESLQSGAIEWLSALIP